MLYRYYSVISTLEEEYRELGVRKINHVQIFENKGGLMGCSNPSPGQYGRRIKYRRVQKKI